MEANTHATALLLVLVSVIAISPASTAATTTTSFDAAASFIISTCGSVTYPKLCEKTCLPLATTIQVDIEKMAHYALNAALGAAKNTSWTEYQGASEKINRSEKIAIQDCMRLSKDSIAQITQSLNELDNVKNSSSDEARRFKLSNVKTWMSAALTDYRTCMDGLAEVNASAYVRTKFSSKIQYATMLSSNALAIVNKI